MPTRVRSAAEWSLLQGPSPKRHASATGDEHAPATSVKAGLAPASPTGDALPAAELAAEQTPSLDFGLELRFGLKMLVTLTLHDAESLPVWHRNQTTTPAGSSRRLMRTREVMGAALVSMYSVLAAKNSAIPLAEVKRCLHRFAFTEFESVMEGSEIPGIRAVTEADLDTFVVRDCGTGIALYPLELCVGLTLLLHVFNL